MMNNHPSNILPQQRHDFNVERFKTRLTAKSCVAFITVTQIIIRLIIAICGPDLSLKTLLLTIFSLVFYVVMTLIICFEYFLYRKIGPRVMNYSHIIDIILLLLFTAEWIIAAYSPFTAPSVRTLHSVPVTAILTYTGFTWRILFLLFLVQSWKLLIIPPIIAMSLVIGFVCHSAATSDVFAILRGVPQIIYIIIMLWFLDRIKWKEILTNVQQEKWIKINDFVLNNIPENIVILELGGSVTFVSNYCKEFMQKIHLSQNPKELFSNIHDLDQQPETDLYPVKQQIERLTTSHGLLESATTENPHVNLQRVDNLEALLQTFQSIIKEYNLQERQFLVYNGKLQVEDHHTKSIEIKISYIQQHNKQYTVLIIRDTTQRDLLVTLEDNNKYKDQLLASVSHELRAPLNGNINLVDSAIQSSSVPDNIKEKLLTPALRSSKFLLHLINDILDMSQIKAHKLRLIFQPGNLKETLHDTLQLIELQAKKKGVELSLIIHPDIHKILYTDHVRLSQIVLNLLNNAIKFTQKGSVRLSAWPTDNSNLIKISVQDSGIGMTQDDIKKLFSDYTHIEFKERADINPTGVGLGLSIAYNLAKLLGPRGIIVESIPGQGSTFSFIVENKEDQLDPKDLVLKNTSDKSQEVPSELQDIEPKISLRISKFSSGKSTSRLLLNDSDESKCSCAKILVVDDNPFNTMAFETVLESLHLKCDSVFDGREGIDKILNKQNTCCHQPYSVIFMDQEMLGLTGSETVSELRRLQNQNLVPVMKIIGCTAHGSPEEVNKFMESGLDMCIQKPITVSSLQKILKEFPA